MYVFVAYFMVPKDKRNHCFLVFTLKNLRPVFERVKYDVRCKKEDKVGKILFFNLKTYHITLTDCSRLTDKHFSISEKVSLATFKTKPD